MPDKEKKTAFQRSEETREDREVETRDAVDAVGWEQLNRPDMEAIQEGEIPSFQVAPDEEPVAVALAGEQPEEVK